MTAPEAARSLFPADRLEIAQAFAERLAGDGVVRGLIGPREAPRLWERHLLNCALLAPALPGDARVADIGSGAGLPGLVLAIARPDITITLIEPLLRRTTFLEEVVADLGLGNVIVVRGRADALHGQETYDVVTSRAVAPLDRLLAWSMPLVAPEGVLMAMKGSSVAEEIEQARAVLKKLRCAEPSVETLGLPGADPEVVHPIRIVRVTWADPARVSLPSRTQRDPRGSRPSRDRNKRRKS
ncbi:16S rRNA (guanine(527)-N(7))-methyltransferase RsmG [Nocardioides sp. Root190]|uniref:16S rRNA (guanine(527)-N(7))-methyltransferase RsmG n=1 Tax=Nocardioides sp. Root190 TaxID=1736488 RepID=UPI001F191EC1|nr:16S rRNA (guanine(527)-N(7))-methyltransferase RsmG [Nocardioides sp. Root190]